MTQIYEITVDDEVYEVIEPVEEYAVEFVEQIYELTGVAEVGPPGPQGLVGPEGPIGPEGPPGPDANYVQPFTNSSTVTVIHNLNKRPAVTVIDSAGDRVHGDVYYLDVNSVVVNFTGSFSGLVICN